jgi:SNF2 family DNA or RNA helicase
MYRILCKKKSNRSTKYFIFSTYNKLFVEKIKALPYETRKFNSTSKCWEINAYYLMELIKQHKGEEGIFFDFEGEENKQTFKDSVKKEKIELDSFNERLNYKKEKQEIIKNLKLFLKDNYNIINYKEFLNDDIVPYPHQLIGAKLANEMNKIIIAADMGCGKTLMSILSIEMKLKGFQKVLVIVPNGLKLNWRNEIQLFTKSKWHVLNATKKTNLYTIEESKYIIVNYEYFRSSSFNEKEKLIKIGLNPENIDCLIFDEAHRLKNQKSNTTKNILKSFKKSVDNMILLSGTIMPNRLEELYVALNLILPEEFPNKSGFYKDYCGLVYNSEKGRYESTNEINGSEPDLELLHSKLDGIMYRVRKDDVLKDLPPLQVSKISLEMSNKEELEYMEIEKKFETVNWGSNDDNHLTILNELRQFTSQIKSGKIVRELIADLNANGEKVVIYDIYKKNLKILSEEVPNSKFYSGDISVTERQAIIDEFQNKDSGLMNLFITQQSGKEGITLTAASYMILLSQSYVPGENDQTYARIHRIGQKNSANVYIICLEGTIDDNIYYINNTKQKTISKVIDNVNFVDKNEKSVIGELINKFRKKYNGN